MIYLKIGILQGSPNIEESTNLLVKSFLQGAQEAYELGRGL